jgi:hypothetical protein
VVLTLAELLQQLESNPHDPRLLTNLGEFHHQRGELSLAAEAFRRLAEVYAADAYFLKAIAVAKQAMKFDPFLIDVQVRLADWLLQLELWDEAETSLRMAEQSFLAANRPEDAAAVRLRLDALKKDTEPFRERP